MPKRLNRKESHAVAVRCGKCSTIGCTSMCIPDDASKYTATPCCAYCLVKNCSSGLFCKLLIAKE